MIMTESSWVACGLLVVLACSAVATPTGRIVGGTNAYEGQFPHQISLRFSGSHICGGSIISRDYVLTAAHCVTSEENGVLVVTNAKDLSIRAGSLDRFTGGVLVDVIDVIVHETYGNFLNDVAVLRLKSQLILSSKIQPVALAASDTPVNSAVIISGWGRVKTGGDIPRYLLWNQLTSLSTLRCNAATLMFTDSLICLAHPPANGACNGDSGGPAVGLNGELIGIAGFVMSGCGSSNPDGYAKVFYHRDWIIKNANLKV